MSNSDTDLRSAIASACINANNMCDDFEGAAGFLLPVFPYANVVVVPVIYGVPISLMKL